MFIDLSKQWIFLLCITARLTFLIVIQPVKEKERVIITCT